MTKKTHQTHFQVGELPYKNTEEEPQYDIAILRAQLAILNNYYTQDEETKQTIAMIKGLIKDMRKIEFDKVIAGLDALIERADKRERENK